MQKIWKIAVIGSGDMGRHHVEGWQMAGQKVISVTDIDQERVGKLANEFGIQRIFSDYKDAISDPEVEIVSICLPLALHSQITIYAAECSKHIFCEKPLAPNFREVAKMEAAITESGVQFGIGFQRNLCEGVKEVANLIQHGRIGRPVVFHCDSVAEIRPKRVMHDANGNMGPLMDLGCHYYIMWQTVFKSMPKTVYARGTVMGRDRQELSHIKELAIDTAVVTVEYESGDVGIFTVSWGMPPKFKMQSYTDRVYGPKGGVMGQFNSNTKSIVCYEEDQVHEIELETYPSLHAEQFRLFVNALNQGKQAPVSLQAGKDVLALTLAIFQSIETGEVIDFSLFHKKITDINQKNSTESRGVFL